MRLCEERGLACRITDRNELDIASPKSVEEALERYAPWAVVNAAGFSAVAAAETEAFRCFRQNTKGPAVLAAACQQRALPLVLFSTAHVFDGKKRPDSYVESDPTCPVNVYGRSKVSMEKISLGRARKGILIIRSSALFGPWDSSNFITVSLQRLAQDLPVTVSDDVLTPAYLPDFGHAVLDLLIDGAEGIWHLGHPEPMRRSEIVHYVAGLADLDTRLIHRSETTDYASGLRNTDWAVLASEKTRPLLPPLESALGHFVACAADQWNPHRNARHFRTDDTVLLPAA